MFLDELDIVLINQAFLLLGSVHQAFLRDPVYHARDAMGKAVDVVYGPVGEDVGPSSRIGQM